jgi:hypothetical protein
MQTIMTHIDEGNNGRIYETPYGIKKIQKRRSAGHDILTQKRIHRITEVTVYELKLQKLFVPSLNLENGDEYEMQRISTQKIIYPGAPNHGELLRSDEFEQLVTELSMLWIALWNRGFAAWDYELFLQPDGRIALIDFDKFGFHMTSGPVSTILPLKRPGYTESYSLRYFFQNPCFPHDFVERLRALGFEVPADCLPSL